MAALRTRKNSPTNDSTTIENPNFDGFRAVPRLVYVVYYSSGWSKIMIRVKLAGFAKFKRHSRALRTQRALRDQFIWFYLKN